MFTLALGLTTPYSLGILVWNFYQTFVTVSIEFLLRFEPHIRLTRLAINFLFFPARAERMVFLYVKLFDFFVGEYSSVWPETCCVLFQNQWRLLGGISGKNYSQRIFQKFCANQGYHLQKLVKLRPNFCNFMPGSYCAEKIHTSTFICCFHPGKVSHPLTNHKKKIRGRKARTFVFGKPVLFTLGLGFTTPYSLGNLVIIFSQTFVTVTIEIWLRFKP